MMNLKPNKVGKFSISDEVLISIGWEKLGQILGKSGMLIIRAEHRLDTRSIECIAFCPMFDEVPEAIPAPSYRAEVEHKDRVLGIYFRRVS